MKIIRQKRRSIVLQIKGNGEVILKVPKGLEQEKIDEFLNSKKSWLEKNLKKLEQNLLFQKEYDFENKVYLFGVAYDKSEILNTYKSIEKFYKSQFNYILERVLYFKNLYSFKLSNIKSCKSVTKWGSYSNKFEMKINIRALLLKKELIDYIIIHEFCHSLYMNHSKDFWNSVQSFLPNYKFLRKELKLYGFLLRSEL